MTMKDEQIRAIFMAHGFTIKDGQTDLKPYVYEAARALLSASKPATPSVETKNPQLKDSFERFDWLCSLLPEGTNWGDALDPNVLDEILLATASPATPAQSGEVVAWQADSLYDAIEKVLLSHKLSNWQDQHENLLGLVDRLCDDDAHDIASGQHAIRLICDEIYNEVLTVAAPQSSQPVEAGEPEWIAKLRKGLMLSKMTHNFTFSRDEVMALLAAPSAVALDGERAAFYRKAL